MMFNKTTNIFLLIALTALICGCQAKPSDRRHGSSAAATDLDGEILSRLIEDTERLLEEDGIDTKTTCDKTDNEIASCCNALAKASKIMDTLEEDANKDEGELVLSDAMPRLREEAARNVQSCILTCNEKLLKQLLNTDEFQDIYVNGVSDLNRYCTRPQSITRQKYYIFLMSLGIELKNWADPNKECKSRYYEIRYGSYKNLEQAVSQHNSEDHNKNVGERGDNTASNHEKSGGVRP